MRFCTAVNCIDGRAQLPVIRFLRRRLGAKHVDVVTEPGPVRVIAEQRDHAALDAIVRGVQASIHLHESRHVAVVAHHDCGGNPVEPAEQQRQLLVSIAHLERRFPEASVIGLWVDARGRVSQVPGPGQQDAGPRPVAPGR